MSILQILSVICFIAAPCLLVASIIIFVKMQVMDAIRFLQHKPTSGRLTGAGSTTRNKGRASRALRKQRAADKAAKTGPTAKAKDAKPVEEKAAPDALKAEKPETKKSTGTVVMGDVDEAAPESSEAATDLLVEEASEMDTALLVEEVSEADTAVLVEEASEAETDVLASPDTEAETDVLAVEPSEQDTAVLVEDEAEAETQVLSVEEFPQESTFMFRLKQDIVMVHTDERVG